MFSAEHFRIGDGQLARVHRLHDGLYHAQLLGGTDTRVLATMIYQYAMSLRDWTQASVVAVVMIVVTMMISGVFNALSRKINPMA